MNATGYFLPDDWILWHSEGLLEATKLSSGDHIRIEGTPEHDPLNSELPASIWDSLARFEPLLGQLREQLQEQALQPLTRETVLRGSGWKQLFVELTAKCNEQCVHCYAESSPTRTEALAWPELRKVLEDAKALDFGLVQLPVLDGDGYPIQKRGVTDYPGLYFIGLPWLHTAKSGLLSGVGDDAASPVPPARSVKAA